MLAIVLGFEVKNKSLSPLQRRILEVIKTLNENRKHPGLITAPSGTQAWANAGPTHDNAILANINAGCVTNKVIATSQAQMHMALLELSDKEYVRSADETWHGSTVVAHRLSELGELQFKSWPVRAGHWIKGTRKEIVTVVVVPAILLLVAAVLGWSTPEGRRLLHLDKPQPEQHAPSPSVPQTKLRAPATEEPANKEIARQKPSPLPSAPITTGPITQGPCSIVQIGGVGNRGTTNCSDVPPQIAVTKQKENAPDNGLFTTEFRLDIITNKAFLLHVKVSAPDLIGNLKIDDVRPPEQGGKAFQATGMNGPGYLEMDYSNIESGGYIVTVQTSKPNKVQIDCR